MPSYNIMSNTNSIIVSFIVVVLCLTIASHGARILGIFPTAAPSHYILGSTYMRALAEAGHDVTVISPFAEKNLPKNGSYTNIILTGVKEKHDEMMKDFDFFALRPSNSLINNIMKQFLMNNLMVDMAESALSHENVQNLLKSNEKFDLVIIEQFMADSLKGIAYHFGAPHINFLTVGAGMLIDDLAGNPSPPSYIPDMNSAVPIKMSFYERTMNVLTKLINKVFYNILFYPSQSKLLKKYFPNAPALEVLNENYSLIMLNSHPSLHQAVPHVPAMIEIGGFHVVPPKRLPEDLQQFLDNAKEGVIYFSMGSNLKSKNLPIKERNAFLQAFGKLKEKVLWKWEDDILPGQPSNVKLGKWLPQSDILAHPNLKVFITHGGLLSTTEAVYHGVPVVAIPIFADQVSNAQQIVDNGYGISLEFDDLSEGYLTASLREILDNRKYRKNAKIRSQVFHDRPQTPLEAAVYWTEYAIRHPGGSHLKVAGAELPWYKYLLLDVFLFITVVCMIALLVLKLLVTSVCTLRAATKNKSKTE